MRLIEGQSIELDSRGLSRFGSAYWDAIQTVPFEKMSDAEQREYLLETIKKEPAFSAYTSRMQAFFGANSIDDSRRFVETIIPRPHHRIPVFEVFSSMFWTLDMNWLDYVTDHGTRAHNSREYWYAAISNHNPEVGERRPPLLEVLMQLPVQVGKIVAWIEPGEASSMDEKPVTATQNPVVALRLEQTHSRD
ncbi:hypothetical protein [Pseudomonas sp. TH15]|uniref:hypothetical protein n=1 Tax=Pseudomonas sp. TH15 TaxID=2796381 RepID=UPI00191249F3|nr:hypothetical protein [Pseudomonas sp. TH15]MBK5512279.1 hypothetical protein [Pseudomonas sp. TH15]